ncbi:MAG: YdcF family protein [Coriobacteriales bacterium]|nr:YdcF family protein [Coriobacteriales bacterium]
MNKPKTEMQCPVSTKKRFLILIPLFVALVIICAVNVRNVGSSYSMPITIVGITQDNAVITYETEGIVDANIVTDSQGKSLLQLKALAPGETFVNVETTGDADTSRSFFALANVDSVSGILTVDGVNFSGYEVIHISIVIFIGVLLVLLIWGFVDLLRQRWYSYEMVAYCGLAMFFMLAEAIFCYLLLPGKTNSFGQLAQSIVSMATMVLYLVTPIMIVMSVGLAVSNISLVRHEGFRPQNLLGFVLGVIWFAFLIFMMGRNFTGSFEEYRIFMLVEGSISMTAIFVIALLLSIFICSWLAVRYVPDKAADYAIILGCGLRKDGTPTPLLKGRIDTMRQWVANHAYSDGTPTVFVPSGGQGPDEVCSEAESMREYLVQNGVPADCIIPEDKSTRTSENMLFSAGLIQKDWEQKGKDTLPSIVFSTTNYHVFRAYICAHQAGMDAHGIASPTRAYFWPNALLREFVGFIMSKPIPLAITLASVLIVYGILQYALIS